MEPSYIRYDSDPVHENGRRHPLKSSLTFGSFNKTLHFLQGFLLMLFGKMMLFMSIFPFATIDGDNRFHVLYHDQSHQISDIYFDGAWRHQSLQQEATKSPLLLPEGDLTAALFAGCPHVVYLDQNDNISDLSYYDGKWSCAPIKTPRYGGNPVSIIDDANRLNVLYRDPLNNLALLLNLDRQTWKYTDLGIRFPPDSAESKMAEIHTDTEVVSS